MSLTYTVTILHDLDPNPSPDHDLREALMAVGCSPDEGDLLASDPIFYLRIPEQDADRVEALAQQMGVTARIA